MASNEKIAELDCGLEVWKLDVTSLKEADVNAQIMDERKMKILASNIKNRGALESLPYISKKDNTFTIISGHHRVKAAVIAGLSHIYGLVDTNEMTKSQVVSKQIAHNELTGKHDSEILQQLIKMMKNVDDIIASGLSEEYINTLKEKSPVMDMPQLEFNWRTISSHFLPNSLKNLEKLVKLVDKKADYMGVAPLDTYKPFIEAVRSYGNANEIKSIGTTIHYLTEIALNELKKWQESQNTTESTTKDG